MRIFSFGSKKGTSLVEVMIALLIISLIILGGGMFFVYGRVHIIREAHRRAAVLVASQRLEELKALDWPPVEDGVSGVYPETVTTGDNLPTPYTITTNAQYSNYDGEDGDDHLEITVTVEWSDSTSNTVSLTTLIADNE